MFNNYIIWGIQVSPMLVLEGSDPDPITFGRHLSYSKCVSHQMDYVIFMFGC